MEIRIIDKENVLTKLEEPNASDIGRVVVVTHQTIVFLKRLL